MGKEEELGFLTELMKLCAKHDVNINGDFWVWRKDADEIDHAVMSDILSVSTEGVEVSQRIERRIPRPWNQDAAAAYDDGFLIGAYDLRWLMRANLGPPAQDGPPPFGEDPKLDEKYPSHYWFGVMKGREAALRQESAVVNRPKVAEKRAEKKIEQCALPEDEG